MWKTSFSSHITETDAALPSRDRCCVVYVFAVISIGADIHLYVDISSWAGKFFNVYASVGTTGMVNAGANHYGSSSRLNTRCNRCRGVGHTSMNCPNVVNASRQRVNNMATGGAQNSCLSNVASAYVGGNAAQRRYGSASRQYVGGY
nr:replication protein A 70 kDa DNA-binding subunit A-like [Tanacetum cinerariifolium]